MKKSCFAFLLISILVFSFPVHAQPTITPPADYLTVAALETADVPPADMVDLARRFRGVDSIPPPPATSPTRTVGETQAFWVVNTDENREFQVASTLRVVGEHIYLWVQSDVNLNVEELQALANAFDETIYPNVRELWGSENTPGIDGDTRLYGLFTRGLGGSVAAYFSSRNALPKEAWANSNQHEMFLFNLDAIGLFNLARADVESVVAHEFQHMIRDHVDPNEAIWLNEGFSSFTQLLQYQDAGSIPYFLNAPDTQLNDWPPDVDTSPQYGAAVLFVAYFYERYGEAALQQLSREPRRGLTGFDYVLKAMGEKGVDEFFADWVLANFVLDPTLDDGRYGYNLLSSAYGRPRALTIGDSYPHHYERMLNQYATDYYVLTGLQAGDNLTLQVSVPDTAPLIPDATPDGKWMWYSNRGDMSDMTLTQAFDLTDVDTATLSYKVWYETEAFYDYGYVTVSSDGGEQWTILTAPGSDTTNPVNGAYGPGYTGTSEGWRDEQISLNAYAGQKILVRFEFIADDSTTSRGMAIDSVRIPEIGYASDFEADDGGWQAAGWVRTDNRLPQRMWVQALYQHAGEVVVKRWLAPLESTWNLPIEVGVEQVLITVSPFAPVTNVPTNYILDVSH